MPIGTRVRLASGGPEMLVVDIDLYRLRVLCAWPEGERWFLIVCVDVTRKLHVVDWDVDWKGF